ncbi:helix-turn-helix domain-containing protein [Bacillus ndiopicus]|uniref:helix-turn-helix domain-containing protein n=1 Tax=Bacillus ndiopicus TaxID=1347368 RepID=UPI0005A92E8E|nr:helix-turn-helix domain-containing protein [Bacillus ndiopicus]
MLSSLDISKDFEEHLTNLILSCTNEMLKTNIPFLKEWFSLAEAATYIGVSHNTLNKFRTMGLKVCEIDGIKRVSKKEIDSFLENRSF